jgi:hypothetical protein
MICRKNLFVSPDSEAEQSNQKPKARTGFPVIWTNPVRAFFIKRGD